MHGRMMCLVLFRGRLVLASCCLALFLVLGLFSLPRPLCTLQYRELIVLLGLLLFGEGASFQEDNIGMLGMVEREEDGYRLKHKIR